MAKSKDLYRKVRRAGNKAKAHVAKYRMKGKVAEEFIRAAKASAQKLAFILVLVVSGLMSCACLEKYTVTGGTEVKPSTCPTAAPGVYNFDRVGPVEVAKADPLCGTR